MSEGLEYLLISVGVISGVAFVAWAFGSMLKDILEMRSISDFSKDFKDAVGHSQPTWEDIKEMASTRQLTQSEIYFTIRKYYREIMAGRDEDLSKHKNLIKGYIDQYRKDEPFEGLPNEVRIHLERLRDNINGNEHLLEPLTSQIKDLLTINKTEKRNQKYFTIGGFFVGLAGFAFAIYTGYSVQKVEISEPKAQIEQKVQSANKKIQRTV